MTGVLITGKTRGRTEAVIASTVDQSVKATIPIEILSTNLLAYGPVSTDTIGVTIQADGGLKILSTAEQSFTVTAANAKSLRFSVKKGSTSSIIDGVIHPRLNIGKSSEWMRPDGRF